MFRAGSQQSGGCRHKEGVLRGRPRDARGEEGDNAAYTAYTDKGKSGFNSEKETAKYAALPLPGHSSSVSSVKINLLSAKQNSI